MRMFYLLPSHPTIFCKDPLGICDDSTTATAWDVISSAISSTANTLERASVSQLPDLVETLVYSLHGHGTLDTQGLRCFLHRNYADAHAIQNLYSAIFKAALSLPDVLPTHDIPYLSDRSQPVSLSEEQITAILAHQLLGTLAPAAGGWGPPTFTCWYAESNPHPMAVEGYLTILLNHFSNLPALSTVDAQFCLTNVTEAINWSDCDSPLHLTLIHIDEESEPSEPGDTLEQCTPAIIIASNRQPGFGPSGTQEERIFASSLHLCPIVLFCPVLPPHAALITSPMPVHAAWRGHNRTAHVTALYSHTSRPTRSYVLMDALELDVSDQHFTGLPDLARENLERELRKVYGGCIGLRAMYPLHTPTIETGAWGCGAFGGNVVVKGIVMAMASSRAGVQMQLRLRRDRVGDLERIARVIEAGLTVGQVAAALKSDWEATQRCQDGDAFVRLLLAAATPHDLTGIIV